MSWKRPKTIKFYLNPPEAERLITVWPDFKVVSKKIQTSKEEPADDFGVHFIFGQSGETLNWQKTKFNVRKDGIPVHTLLSKYKDFRVELESFCNFAAQPATFIRFTVKNSSQINKTLKFGVMPRLARASLLYGIGGDFYSSYVPLLEHWDMANNIWTLENNCLAGPEKYISFDLPVAAKINWIGQNSSNIFCKDYAEITESFKKNETKHYYFLLSNKGYLSVDRYEYDRNLDATIAKWQQEIDKVNIRPATGNKNIQTMFNSLICQCLQMFAVANDGFVRPRQGGQHCGVWSVEAFEFLVALDRVGLKDWSEKGYDFFSKYQIKKGEDRGKFFAAGAPQWMSYTAGVLYGLAYHLRKQDSKEYFAKWKRIALEGLNWVERQRSKTKKDKNQLGYGLLPAGIGNDWGISGQYWSATDGLTYMGVREMAAAFKKFNDPLAGQLNKMTKDYESCLNTTLKKVIEPQKNRKELFLSNILGLKESYPPLGPYFADGPINLIRAGIIEPKSATFKRVENYFVNKGWMKNGLTGLMTDSLLQYFQGDKWAGHTWYVSYSDMVWFYAWLNRGERKKAKKTLEAQLKYGMSPEFYMQERYADNDTSFCPWQPNASANGRTIMMLLDFYVKIHNS